MAEPEKAVGDQVQMKMLAGKELPSAKEQNRRKSAYGNYRWVLARRLSIKRIITR